MLQESINGPERGRKKQIWIDLENSPHVPFFKPIIEELKQRGYEVSITARDCFQVCGLADLLGLSYEKIGRHYGKNKIMKAVGLLIRSLKLAPFVFNKKPDVALSHGSRSQVVIASALRIPSVLIFDYEHGSVIIKPTVYIAPEIIPDTVKQWMKGRVLKYPGLKEDVYVPYFKPDPQIRDELMLNESAVVVTIRPPATEAHYHNAESEKLFEAVINLLADSDGTKTVVLPRSDNQKSYIMKRWSHLLENSRIIIPAHVIDGLNLIWHSDLVISGGGTMNREAAALGVPVYSIFRGKLCAIDRYLADTGRLVLLESVDDVRTKLKVCKREQSDRMHQRNHATLNRIVDIIETVVESN
jgi:predicted glycosyltransferase